MRTNLKLDWHSAAQLNPNSESQKINLGPLTIWLRCLNSEIWLASKSGVDDLDKDNVQDDSNLKWSRWALAEEAPSIKLSPLLPDRALVVHPDHEFRLPPANDAKIFVRVPVNVKIVTSKKAVKLCEISSVRLSNTWFGDFTEGELCYWLGASARRSVFIDNEAAHLCICPILIKNRSNDELLVRRIRLDTTALSVYEESGQLWSSDTTVTFKGDNEGSQIDVKAGAPAGTTAAKLVSGPRVVGKRGGVLRTFGRLFDLSLLES